ncbi:putative nuclease HARBI1 [Sphaerodactylus townsendi]|uniref:putative nuclease HARBI1 n=1 Tax=Sphaerodactylus townsendi TaxID=933632 RepID=UPI0020273AD6|nr:putative nuclease HARBI1 [Sphaerodactylus townsendi]
MESHQVAMPPDTEETELLLLVVTLLCHWTRVVSAAQAFMHATDVHDSLPQASALSPVSGRRARGSRRWVALAAAPTPRRFWVYPHRSRDWWYNCVWSSWNDEEWLKNFRMSRGTFQRIVDSLAPALRRQDTRMRAALPVEMRVGMAIWYLASPNSFREVRQQFGVGTTTAFEAVHEFCEAVKNILFKRVVRFADPVEKVMRGFANIGFPQCVGAIDGCHIQILNPSDAPADYINRKRVASIVLMAVCDDKGRFFEVDIGHPGRSHDAHIFRGCHFTQAMDRGAFFPVNPVLSIHGVAVPPLILADGAFPMRRWLVKPYLHPRNAIERLYNRRMSRARCGVERAFGRLKGRWKCLWHKLPIRVERVNSLVATCVVLHNLCEAENQDSPESEWRTGPLLTQMEEQQPIIIDQGEGSYSEDQHLARGKAVRNALATYLYCNRPVQQ